MELIKTFISYSTLSDLEHDYNNWRKSFQEKIFEVMDIKHGIFVCGEGVLKTKMFTLVVLYKEIR